MKFKVKRNSTVFGNKKPNSPDIKKRKSFRKFLKGSPEIQRSSRLNPGDNDDESDDGILELHPMDTPPEGSPGEGRQRVPILTTEDNIIQEKETIYKPTRARIKVSIREKNIHKRGANQGKCSTSAWLDPEAAERKSLSLAHSKIIKETISEREELDREMSMAKIHSIRFDEPKYNLEGFKRRTKHSQKLVNKHGLKWHVLGADQNYSSNLPLISKTRTNISSDSCSLDHISPEMFTKSNRKINQLA